jgi:uncharacterized protein (TIGR02757 family)
MSRSPPASPGPRPGLKDHLDALCAAVDVEARVAADPIAFPRRYADRRDAEVAGVLASQLAYGRVDLFRPVVASILAMADAAGGPRAFVEGFDAPPPALLEVQYRWNRGGDFWLLFETLRAVFQRWPDLESLFAEHYRPQHLTIRQALDGAVSTLGRLALETPAARAAGVRAPSDLPRGFRYFLSVPGRGSACKRWNMYLRWVVRPADGIDLGLWSALPASALVIPLDTHVSRIARFLGLTHRSDGSWRTAEQVTAGLRAFDSADPIRYDFAIAHLGISGACLGRRDAAICPSCPLDAVCAA